MPGPTLPVPVPIRIDCGDQPVVTYQDVVDAMPAFLRSDDPRPVRDAIFSAVQVILMTYQARAGYGSALADVLRSEDEYLQQIGRERGIFLQPGDTNETLRARILTAPNIVTPEAILAAANTVLSPYTTIQSKYYETVSDRWYVGGATAGRTWASFLYLLRSEATQSPNYPERIFQGDQTANAGVCAPQRDPGNVRTFNDHAGRYFVLRVPDLSPIDTGGTYVSQPGGEYSLGIGWFVGATGTPYNTRFLRVAGAGSLGVYAQLANVIDRIKGQSIRWMMVADASLR